MKTKLLIISLLCFALLATTSAQEPTPQQLQQQVEMQLQRLLSPMERLDWEAERLAALRSPWNGQGSWGVFRIMMVYGGENALGLTEEQKRQFTFSYTNGIETNWHVEIRQNPTPEYTQALEAIRAALLPDDPLFEHATEEQKNALREALARHSSLLYEAKHNEIQEILTPEQMLQVRKLEMQLMPAMGIPFPAMFEPLGLTEEQKAEMDKIVDEMKAEFDRLVLESVMEDSEQVFSRYESLRGKSFTSQEEFQQALGEARRVTPNVAEATHRRHMELLERGVQFTTLLQNRLMNVLTDEQLDEMQTILDETPAFARAMITRFRMMQTMQMMSPRYVPGPDSWRPGMPLPGQIRQERSTGTFPRTRN